MRNRTRIALGLALILSALKGTPPTEGWRDLAGLSFSNAQPRFEAEVANDETNERARLGLALSLWAAQPTRGPDYDRAVQGFREIAEAGQDPELAAAARFLWGRASWLGGDSALAQQIFGVLTARLDSAWAEQAAVASVQISLASNDRAELERLVERANQWAADMQHPEARLGLHLAVAEVLLVKQGDRAGGLRHLEAALAEENVGFRLRADLLLSAGRLLAPLAPDRSARYLEQFLVENLLDGRRELAESMLATMALNRGMQP